MDARRLVTVALQHNFHGVFARPEDKFLLQHAIQDDLAFPILHGITRRVIVKPRLRVVKDDEVGEVRGAALAHEARALGFTEPPGLFFTLDHLPFPMGGLQVAIGTVEIVLPDHAAPAQRFGQCLALVREQRIGLNPHLRVSGFVLGAGVGRVEELRLARDHRFVQNIVVREVHPALEPVARALEIVAPHFVGEFALLSLYIIAAIPLSVAITHDRPVEGDGMAIWDRRFVVIVFCLEPKGCIRQHQRHGGFASEGKAVALKEVVHGQLYKTLAVRKVGKAEGGKVEAVIVPVEAEQQRVTRQQAADQRAVGFFAVFHHEARHAFHRHAGIAGAVNVVGDGIDAAFFEDADIKREFRAVRARVAQRGRGGHRLPFAVRVQLEEGEGIVGGRERHIPAVGQRIGNDIGRPCLAAARFGSGVLRLDADDVGVVRQHAEGDARRARGSRGQVVAEHGVIVLRFA